MTTSPDRSRVIAGRYHLRSVLGTGSMGTVWSAYDEFLQRPVAVKEIRMPPGVPATHLHELRMRTLREARATAALSHPNVIILHDVVRENGDPFVVMELLPSHSLTTLLRKAGPLTVMQSAGIADAVAAALEAAHAAGVTHRDIKPGNVLICPDGRIKLTDFGIAHNVSEATMTHTGTVLGSPAFIAPEVASGAPVSHAADLWGLGATLFAAIEGHPPYDTDDNPLDIVTRIVHSDVPTSSPGPLAPIVHGLMTKEPTDRLSLSEVRHQISPLLAQSAHSLFPAEAFRDNGENDPDQQLDETTTHVILRSPEAELANETEPPNDEPLAMDPGPLPFTPSESDSEVSNKTLAKQSEEDKFALTVVAILVFLAAALIGFMLVRILI